MTVTEEQTTLVSLFPQVEFGNCIHRVRDPEGNIKCTKMGWDCEGPSEEWGCGFWRPRDKRKGPFYWNISPDKGHNYPLRVKDLSLYGK